MKGFYAETVRAGGSLKSNQTPVEHLKVCPGTVLHCLATPLDLRHVAATAASTEAKRPVTTSSRNHARPGSQPRLLAVLLDRIAVAPVVSHLGVMPCICQDASLLPCLLTERLDRFRHGSPLGSKVDENISAGGLRDRNRH